MPLRPPACCKAAQRRLFASADSIWVSDEVLSAAFQRFCSLSRTSRTSKRYGSSVPGPMESRRRLGKRRMTHVSESLPSPSYNPVSLWGSFWDSDRTQWQWQAPTPRSPDLDKSEVSLPTWLLEWDTTSQRSAVKPADVEILKKLPNEESVRTKEDILRFRNLIRSTNSRDSIAQMVADCSTEFKKSLTLGLVSNETLHFTLRCIPKDLMAAWPTDVTSDWCLSFYTAVWEGIEESKVLGPVDVSAHTMDRLFSLVVALPLTQGTQALAVDILRSVSEIQLRRMERHITLLVEKWSNSWLGDQELGDCAKELRSAESLVGAVEKEALNAQTLVMALKQGPDYESRHAMARDAISSARKSVAMAIDATVQAEDIFFSLRASVKILAQALGKLPRDLVVRLIPSWSTRFIVSNADGEKIYARKYRWLSVLAQMSNVDDRLLVRTWQQLDPSNQFNKCSVIILDHWISQGKVANPLAVRNTFTASLSSCLRGAGFAKLLLSLDKHREMCWTRTGELFDLLYKLGRQQTIPDTLFRMNELDLKIPTTMLAAGIERMSAHDNKNAMAMFRVPHRMRVGYAIRPDWIPKFVTSTIHDQSVPPAAIWKLLNIPIYKGGPTYQPHFAKPLPREMVDLIHKMATAFAHSNARSVRVAFRNIEQCMHHLQIHNAPISSELTRAIVHVAVTRSMLGGLFVSQERLRYALRLVAEVEGEEVAKKADAVVFGWRQVIHEKRNRQRREGNVLRSSPRATE